MNEQHTYIVASKEANNLSSRMDKAINIIDDTVNSYFVSIQRLEGSVHS